MKRSPEALNLARQAYLEIRADILSGCIALGTPISRRKLAQVLGMSVVPVSGALQQLESEGLVESLPRVGTRVRIPTMQDIRGHYVVREALESQSARLFSQKASPEEREEVLRLAAKLDARYQSCSSGVLTYEENFQLHEQHFRFHMRIAECSGHAALCQAIERNQVLTFNWLYDTAANRTSFPPNHHSGLAEALAQSELERADAAMRAHVVYGCEELLQRLEPIFSPGLIRHGNRRSKDKRPGAGENSGFVMADGQ